MIIEHLFVGGIYFMLPIFIMWIVVIFFTVKFLLNYFSEKRDFTKLKKQNSFIIFFGSLAFLFGILGQVIGIYEALSCIEIAGDISPSLVLGGLKVSMLAPLYGFVLFLISGIIWFIFKNLMSKKLPK